MIKGRIKEKNIISRKITEREKRNASTIALFSALIIHILYKEEMRGEYMIGKRKCTEETEGMIIKVKNDKTNNPSSMTVQYMVGEEKYEVKERVMYTFVPVKSGILIIDHKQVPLMDNIAVGNKTVVRYNPDNPKKAYIRNNNRVVF